jgi:hypothetical protein
MKVLFVRPGPTESDSWSEAVSPTVVVHGTLIYHLAA